MGLSGAVLAVPLAKATRERRRLTAISPLARTLREDLVRNSRALEEAVMAVLLDGGILSRIADSAPPVVEKEAGDRVVFRETEALDDLFATYAAENAVILEEAHRRAFNVAAQRVAVSLGADFSFILRNPDVLERLAERANLLSGDVSDDTFDRIRDTIRKTFWEDRQGVDAVARALEEEFEFLNGARARLIAHQETLTIVEEATQESFQRDGINRKRWLASINNPTPPRPSHREAHGQVVGVDEPFIVGGSELMHPGDPNAPLEETMNCRCDSVAVIEGSLNPEDFWTGE